MSVLITCLQLYISPLEGPQASHTQPALNLSSSQLAIPTSTSRRWCCQHLAAHLEVISGNSLFTFPSSLSSLPHPTHLIRVDLPLLVFRATTFEKLPNRCPEFTLQPEQLLVTQIRSSFPYLTIDLTIESNFFRPSIL